MCKYKQKWFIEDKVFYAMHSRLYCGSVFITQACGDRLIHGIAHHIVLKMVESPQELTDLQYGTTLSECYKTPCQIPVFVLGSD
jgi:hypothetical protein